jgi:hypothetical protein
MTYPILKEIHQLRSNMKFERTLTNKNVRIKIKTKEYKVFHHSMNNAFLGDLLPIALLFTLYL